MAKKCKNCKCNKKVVIPPTPCFTSAGCPPKPACEDTFDIDCVNYTGEDIICNNAVVVESGDSLTTALTALVDQICNKQNCDLQVEFTYNAAEGLLNFTINNGEAPFDIKASMAQQPLAGIKFAQQCVYPDGGGDLSCSYGYILQSQNGFSVQLCCSIANSYVTTPDAIKRFVGTIKLDITDSRGCNKEVFYTVDINEEDCISCPVFN